MEKQRLYRNVKDRYIGGVAGGIAEYFNMDSVVVRLIFVLVSLVGGSGILIYIILWIAVPETEIISFENKNNTNMETENKEVNQDSEDFKGKESSKINRTNGSFVGGAILITLGILFFLDNFIPNIDFGDLWPIILIVIGISILVRNYSGKSKKENSKNQ